MPTFPFEFRVIRAALYADYVEIIAKWFQLLFVGRRFIFAGMSGPVVHQRPAPL
jgi:hypothetical protein